ncbi:MAG: hypothetical protein JRJ71_16070 [Deltaproteobacteria bacterium]|nr:hypothetical protein [Deltaproteobacteria bacterium]
MDSARTALRLGAGEVVLIYGRSREEMPPRDEEIRHAEEEGLRFEFLRSPIRIFGSGDGRVTGLGLISMALGEPDSSGRRRPIPVAGSERTLEVDTVIVAIGQRPNPMIIATTSGLKKSSSTGLPVDRAMFKAASIPVSHSIFCPIAVFPPVLLFRSRNVCIRPDYRKTNNLSNGIHQSPPTNP